MLGNTKKLNGRASRLPLSSYRKQHNPYWESMKEDVEVRPILYRVWRASPRDEGGRSQPPALVAGLDKLYSIRRQTGLVVSGDLTELYVSNHGGKSSKCSPPPRKKNRAWSHSKIQWIASESTVVSTGFSSFTRRVMQRTRKCGWNGMSKLQDWT